MLSHGDGTFTSGDFDAFQGCATVRPQASSDQVAFQHVEAKWATGNLNVQFSMIQVALISGLLTSVQLGTQTRGGTVQGRRGPRTSAAVVGDDSDGCIDADDCIGSSNPGDVQVATVDSFQASTPLLFVCLALACGAQVPATSSIHSCHT